MAWHLGSDGGGTTSLRMTTDRVVDENKYPPGSVTAFAGWPRRQPQRDRDLGQTFVTGSSGGRLASVHLRLGPSDRAVLPGARGAEVVLQVFRVEGTPRLNDHGTPGFLGQFDRSRAPELDDYLEGETYVPLAAFRGRLPRRMGPGQYLTLRLPRAVPLSPRQGYAFLLGFAGRGVERSLALANNYYGGYNPDPANRWVGHGIRREGFPELADDLEHRLQALPGTLGFPDVCTYRDLWFFAEGAP